MGAVTVCVIGLGPRGLAVLERLVASARLPRYSDRQLLVALVDPTCTGVGMYGLDQPDYLLLNIVCSQVSQFPDSASVRFAPGTPGPSLFEWARARDIRLEHDYRLGDRGREIEPGDFLPRRLLGEYLRWCLERLLREAPPNVTVRRYRTAAVDLTLDRGRPVVSLATGEALRADHVFLTIGQLRDADQEEPPAHGDRLLHEPYPLPDRTAVVKPQEALAVAGMGLTAVDVILTLTVGRGGRFEQTSEGRRRYVASGAEPRLLAYSRSGLPYRARPQLGARYNQPVRFTTPAIDQRRSAQGGRLDFEVDVLPLLLTEMTIAYHLARTGLDRGAAERARLRERLLSPASDGSLGRELRRLDDRGAPFDAAVAYFGRLPERGPSSRCPARFLDGRDYQRACADWIASDLEMAEQGVSGSPTKAALEVCRELRDVIRHAVDFGGLTPESQDRFFGYHAKLIDRAVVGPQKERNADLLALLEADVLRLPLGPDPRVEWRQGERRWRLESRHLARARTETVEWLYKARSSVPKPPDRDRGLIGSLYRKGLLRRHRPDSSVVVAIDLDANFHPIDANGEPLRSLFVLGPLCEGVTYYNNYVTSPGKYSRAMDEADRCVAHLLRRCDTAP